MPLYRIPILIVLLCVLCSACNNEKHTSPQQNEKINTLILESQNKNYALENRLKYIDSAYNFTRIQLTDSLTLSILKKKADLHYKLKEHDSTLFYDKLLRIKAKKAVNILFQAKAHMNLAYDYRIEDKYDSAYYHFDQSKIFYANLRDTLQVAKRLISMGIIQNEKADYFGSKQTLTEALEQLSNIKNSRSIASAHNTLGSNHRKLSNYSDAVDSYEKAIKINPSEKSKLIYKNNLAATYIDLKEYAKAIQLLQEILDAKTVEKTSSQYARVLDNLSYATWLATKNTSVVTFTKALKIRKENKDLWGLLASYTHLGEFYAVKKPPKAILYLDTVIQLSRKVKNPKAEVDALHFLMQINPKSIAYKDSYIFLKDSLYQQELKVKTQFAHIQYNAEEANKAVLRLEKTNAEKETETAKQKNYKLLFLFSCILLLIGGVLWYYVLLQRQKKENIRHIYNTEKRISKVVHDELANDIYGVINSIEHDNSFTKESLLNRLERVYKRTRNISHENADIQTENFKEELKILLGQFQNKDTTITVKGMSNIPWHSFSNEKKIVLYRVVNELLVNMKKHANASLVVFSFETQKKETKLTYKDNGKGVLPTTNKGIGLQNAENRIKSIGGTFSFDSELEKGMVLSCTFPI